MQVAGWVAAYSVVVVSGCQLERLFPEEVGLGAARLTIQNAGNLLALIDADDVCGFANPDVLANYVVDGVPGSPGTVTWTVTDCALDFGADLKVVGTDCQGGATGASGSAIVNASRTVAGKLTGDPGTPVIPLSADSVTLSLSADVLDYRILGPGGPAKPTTAQSDVSTLRMQRGIIEVEARVHLAQSAGLGVCSVATPALSVDAVRVRDAIYEIDSAGRNFTVPVSSAELSAQVGAYQERENRIVGSIKVWEANVAVNEQPLDPSYDAKGFVDSFACKPDLQMPLSYECLTPEPALGAGAARLAVVNTASLLALIDADTNCGFQSTQASVVVEGTPGGPGRATWSVQECAIRLGDTPVVVGTDCTGVQTLGSGTVVVSGTRTVEGRVTGDASTPIIPLTPDAAHLDLQVSVDDFQIHRGDQPSLRMKSGTLLIAAAVHLAQSASLGVCSIPTSDVSLDIGVSDGLWRISSGSTGIAFTVPTAAIEATPGAYGGRENFIGGHVQVWDVNVDLAADSVLDADYDRNRFVAAFSCAEDLKQPIEYECLPIEPRLADGVAKLTIKNVGAVVSAFAKDTTCGFKSPAVLAAAAVEGAIGHLGGRVTYSIDVPCELDLGAVNVPADCNGLTEQMTGRARMTGSLSINGRLTGDPSDLVIPSLRDAAEISFRIEMDAVSVAGAQRMESTGMVSGLMHPRLALDTATGACSIETPVVAFEDVSWSSGSTAVLRTSSGAIAVQVNGSTLTAQSGEKDGRENYLAGSVVLDNDSFDIPIAGAPILDPDYDRAAYLSTWSCAENLRVPLSDDECSMKQIIADGVARLIIQNVGTLAGAINKDEDCGFSNTMDVLKNPSQVIGSPGQVGALSWVVANCRVGSNARAVYEEDCSGNSTKWQGHANIDSARTVRGMREQLSFAFGLVQVQSIAPMDAQSVDLWLYNVRLQEFSSFVERADGRPAPGVLTIHDGTVEAFLQPKTGYSSQQQRFTVPTSEALIGGVRLRNSRVSLLAQGKRFEVEISDTDLYAANGSVAGFENEISGSIIMDGELIDVSGALDPGYDPVALKASFACNVAPEVGCAQTGKGLCSVLALFGLVLRRRRR